MFAALDRQTRDMDVGGEDNLREAREAGMDRVGGMGRNGVRTSHLHRCIPLGMFSRLCLLILRNVSRSILMVSGNHFSKTITREGFGTY